MAKPTKFRGKWRIRWFDEFGKRQSDVFSEYRHAAAELRRHEHEVEEVRRGLRSPMPPHKTFGDFCDYWIANRAPLKHGSHHDVSIIRAHLRPAFGTLHLRELGTAHADRFMIEKGHLNSKTVLNIITLLLSMLRTAVDLGWLVKVPRIRKPKVRIFDKDFSYLRTDDEIARFVCAARAEGEGVYALYVTAVFTGMRAGELAGLRWADVEFSRRIITVQRSYLGPTKAGDVRHVPLLDALLPTLREWRVRTSGALVFPSEAGTMQLPSARVFQDIFHRVLDVCGFPQVERRGKLRRYIVYHDLRHTFASHWVMRGGDLFKLQKVLGHKTVQMTMRYAHLAPDVFAADYGRLGSAPPTATNRQLR